jgi:transcriptional regulator with XRE-family HTH domain
VPNKPSSVTRKSSVNRLWFEDALRAVSKSQAELARHLDVSPSQVSKLFKGERRVQLDEIESISLFLNKPIRDVLINLGVKLDDEPRGQAPQGRSVPVVGNIDPDGTVHIDLQKPIRNVEAPGRVPPGTAAVVVPPAMAASLHAVSGLYFFVVPDKLDPAAVGRLAIVRQARGPWLLRTVSPSLEPGRYDLSGPEGIQENQTITLAGPILMIRP